jgi:hypothetical protein
VNGAAVAVCIAAAIVWVIALSRVAGSIVIAGTCIPCVKFYVAVGVNAWVSAGIIIVVVIAVVGRSLHDTLLGLETRCWNAKRVY